MALCEEIGQFGSRSTPRTTSISGLLSSAQLSSARKNCATPMINAHLSAMMPEMLELMPLKVVHGLNPDSLGGTLQKFIYTIT